ncbi:TadE family protein [Galactobacter sp.]|uniref:TadE family protein n=1 Tax=Galactobacter sp. TaxID=2676125 RepID=UPI0025C441D4|nr:TadE family protein [Galactobacter sp.]
MGRDRRHSPACRQRGSVTAELAVLMPVILFVILTVVGAAVVGSGQVRVQQAAGAIAREHARGDGGTVNVVRVAGDGAAAKVSESGGWTTVTVQRQIPLWKAFGPGITVKATALARSEVVEQ